MRILAIGLVLHIAFAFCGNGIIDKHEECDDESLECSNCFDLSLEECYKDNCILWWELVISFTGMTCDDGNNINGDGCSGKWKTEYGYICFDNPTKGNQGYDGWCW